jgi:GMP synthase-like glutamine amidotransferase
MNILIIYFDFFCKNLVKRFIQYKIQAFITKYENAHIYLNYDIDILIISGSEKRILRDNNLPILEEFIKKNIKIIGLCFGFQYLAFITNGIIKEGIEHKGNEILRLSNNYYLLYYFHNDRVLQLTKNWKILLKKNNYIVAAKNKNWFCYQFHPEKYKSTFEIFLLPLLKNK